MFPNRSVQLCIFFNYRINPIGLVESKYSKKKRLIVDLSAPHNDKDHPSINSLIDKDSYSLSYVTVDDAIKSIQKLGKSAWMNKADIQDAFKLLPIKQSLWPFYSIKWNNNYYFFVCLPFGSPSSPKLFDRLIDSPDDGGERTFAMISFIFNRLKIPLSVNKTVRPVQEIEYLGIILDSNRMEARLPQENVLRIMEMMRSLLNRRKYKSLSSTITNRRSISEKRSFNERLNLSINRIDSIVTNLFNNAISSTSKTSYSSGYQLFTRFAVISGLNMHSYRLPHNPILRFIAFCHGIRNIRYSTIRSYLAAICLYRLRAGFSDPFLDMRSYKLPQIEMILKGARRLDFVSTIQCKPITIDILNKLIGVLRCGIFNPYLNTLMQAALTTAFWSFFRSGELFPDKFSPRLHVTKADIQCDINCIIIH
ncbi:unnamed protein product [Rotaria sp. Silwood1]|nr:unnamed protein product [Rotaria sp. Silwood1]